MNATAEAPRSSGGRAGL